MDESKLLLVFMDVVDQGSFVKAAKLRNTDPGRITKQIKMLESQLDAVLLNRSTRSMSLTEIGEKVYRKAQKIKLLLDEVTDIPSEYQQKVQGIVKVTSPLFIGHKYLAPAIQQIQTAHPDVTFELELTDEHTDIIKEGFDLAIRQWRPKDSNLIATKLRDVELKLIASPKFVEKYPQLNSIHELIKLPACLYRRKNIYRNKINYFDANQALTTQELSGAFIVNDGRLIVETCLTGNTFANVADYMAEEYLTSGQLIQLLPNLQQVAEQSVYAVYPHRSIGKGTRLLIDTLKQMFNRK